MPAINNVAMLFPWNFMVFVFRTGRGKKHSKRKWKLQNVKRFIRQYDVHVKNFLNHIISKEKSKH